MRTRERAEPQPQAGKESHHATARTAIPQEPTAGSNAGLGNRATIDLIQSKANHAASVTLGRQLIQRQKQDQVVQLPELNIAGDIAASDLLYTSIWQQVLMRSKDNALLNYDLLQAALDEFAVYVARRMKEFKEPEEGVLLVVEPLTIAVLAYWGVPSLAKMLGKLTVPTVAATVIAHYMKKGTDSVVDKLTRPAKYDAKKIQKQMRNDRRAILSDAKALQHYVEESITPQLQTIIEDKRANKPLSPENDALEEELSLLFVNDRLSPDSIDDFLWGHFGIPTPAIAQTHAEEAFRGAVEMIEMLIIKHQGKPANIREQSEYTFKQKPLLSAEQRARDKADAALDAKRTADGSGLTCEPGVLQRMPASPTVTDAPAGATIEERISRERLNKGHIDTGVRRELEHALGADFSSVNIHASPEADALAQQLDAKAFTTGEDIFFRSGEYDPLSPSGRYLLAHELVHVHQQQNGLTGDAPGLQVNAPGDRYEQEADVKAHTVLGKDLPAMAKDVDHVE